MTDTSHQPARRLANRSATSDQFVCHATTARSAALIPMRQYLLTGHQRDSHETTVDACNYRSRSPPPALPGHVIAGGGDCLSCNFFVNATHWRIWIYREKVAAQGHELQLRRVQTWQRGAKSGYPPAPL